MAPEPPVEESLPEGEPPSPEGLRRRGRRRRPSLGRQLLAYLGLMLGAFIIGLMLFNLVIMPAFVRHRDEVRVPDLTGKELGPAEVLLSSVGLKLGDTRQRNDPRRTGTIVAQHPAPNSSVKTGRTVAVVVSLGERGSQVPDLRGETLRNAEMALTSADLALGQLITAPSTSVDRDAVIATEPAAGSQTARGSKVDVLVSAGSPATAYLMPDLRGLEVSEVERRLKDAGFEVDVTESGGFFRGHRRIKDHDPAPGGRVYRGGRITLHKG